MTFYLRQLEPFTVSTHALYCHFLSGHFFHNLSLISETRFENLRQIQRKKLFCDTVFSVISICATDWNYREAVVKYFTFSFFYTSYWPSSRSVLQVTDRFLPCRCMAKGEVYAWAILDLCIIINAVWAEINQTRFFSLFPVICSQFPIR